MRDKGKTIVFVTHDMGSLQRFCHRAMLLERGTQVYLGEPHEVADRYLEINFGREPETAVVGPDERSGDGEARVVEVWISDETGQRLSSVPQGIRATLNARVEFRVSVSDPAATLYVLNDEHKAVFIATTETDNEHSGNFTTGDEVVFSFAFDNVLGPGRYSPMITLSHLGFGMDVMDRFEGSFSFVVTGVDPLGGLIDLPVQVGIQRTDSALARELGL
jgi:hypothetical protein